MPNGEGFKTNENYTLPIFIEYCILERGLYIYIYVCIFIFIYIYIYIYIYINNIYIYKPSLDKSFTAFFYWKTKTEKERRFTRNVGLCCSSVWKTICTGSEGIKEYFIHVHTISDILGTVWSTGMTLLFSSNTKFEITNIEMWNILNW